MINSPEKLSSERQGTEQKWNVIKVILMVIGMQLFHIRSWLFCIVKCILDLRGNKPFLWCKRTIVEVEEERECAV